MLSDDYGNYCIINNEELAQQIMNSGANPFNHLEMIEETEKEEEVIITSYEQFCNYFY